MWVMTPVFSLELYQQGADNLSYYEVKITKKEIPSLESKVKTEQLYNFYIDIATSSEFKFVMKLDDRNQSIKDETDMVQYQSYLERKHLQMPLYKLSRDNVIKLINKCEELSV